MTGFNRVQGATGLAGVDRDGNPIGDLTGSYPGPIVKGLQTYPIDPRSPDNGDTLVYNGGEWIPTPSPTSTTYFQGVWDANTNTPDIENYPGLSDGFVWLVYVAGNTDVGGITGWIVGDYVVYSNGNWYKLSNNSFGWGLTGNAGTIPNTNYVGTNDEHDLSIRANDLESLRILWEGGVIVTGSLKVVTGPVEAYKGLSGSLTRLTNGKSAFVGDVGILITSSSNCPVVFKVDNSKFASLTGSIFTGPVVFNSGLSGSLTKLSDGTSYILGATNTLVTTASNGSITVSTPAAGIDTQVQFNDGGTQLGANSGLVYNKTSETLTAATIKANSGLSGSLTKLTNGASAFVGDTGILVTSASNGAVTFKVDDSKFAALTGSTFTGTVKFNAGLSGSLTQLVDGTSYIRGATNTFVTSASNGAITVSTPAAGLDTHIQFNDGGTLLGGTSGLTFNKNTSNLTIAGNVAVNGGSVTTTQATGNLFNTTATTLNVGGDATSLTFAATPTATTTIRGGTLVGNQTTQNVFNTTATTVNIAGGATSAVNMGNTAGTNTVLGTTKFPQGLSGSLTKLTDGSSYLIAGQNIAIVSASNAAVNIAFSTPNSPNMDDVLVYNGTTWAPSSIINTLQTSYQTVRAQGNILAGDVCYIVNAGGSNAYPTVAKAQANALATVKGVIGLATANIAANATGSVQTYGQLPGPVDTNNFAQGAPLFVSTTVAGGVTDVKPSGPNYAFQVGFVTRQGQPQNVTTGIVFVSPIMQTDTQNISDIVISNAAEHDILTYEASTLQWKNKQRLWVPNTQTSLQVDNNTIITAANIANVVYLPLVTQGGANKTLNATTPIARLSKTAVDYGRELWLHNVDNNKSITIPAGGSVLLDGGVNLVLVAGAIAKFVWTGIGGNGSWIQTSKSLVVS